MTVILIISIGLALLLALLWRLEPRSMLNAGVFGLLLAFGYLLLMEIAFEFGGIEYGYLALGLFVGGPLLCLVGSVLLVLNGRTVIRKEGLSLSHLLAPLVGGIPLLIVFAVVGIVVLAWLGAAVTSTIGGVLLMLGISVYGYLLATAWFTIPYGALYTLARKSTDVDYIIVHGSGLIDGQVPPLLASRLDKAIEVYNAGGGRATIIPSGGQGADEPRPEAWAMAEYLMAKAIPAENIVPEDQSATTFENMKFSKIIIDKRSARVGHIAFVTSNYHVFRTALIARKVGLKAHGFGSPTARYYLPSAVIREFVAITVMYKWWHIVPIGLLVTIWVAIAFLV